MSLYIKGVGIDRSTGGKLKVSFSNPLYFPSTISTMPSLSTGLLGFWTFDSGTTRELLGRYDITALSIGFPPGKVNLAASFNGSSSRINVVGVPLDSNNWTMAGWVNSSSIPGGSVRWLSYHGSGPTFWSTNGAMSIVHSGTIDFNCNITLVANTWQHIAVTRASTTITSYLNGVQKAQATNFNAAFTADSYLCIGGSPTYSEPFPGLQDEIGIWNRALTPAEIGALHAAGVAGSFVIPAENPTNYSISGVTVATAKILDADAGTVELTCTGLTKGSVYTLAVEGVADVSQEVIAAPNNDYVFAYFSETPPPPLLQGFTGLRLHERPFASEQPLGVVGPVVEPANHPTEVANVTPASSSNIFKDTSVGFDVLDPDGFAGIVVTVEYPDGSTEVVYGGEAFTAAFSGSTMTEISQGYHFEVRRTDGWSSSPVINIHTFDTKGRAL